MSIVEPTASEWAHLYDLGVLDRDELRDLLGLNEKKRIKDVIEESERTRDAGDELLVSTPATRPNRKCRLCGC